MNDTTFHDLLAELDRRAPTREEALYLMRTALGDAEPRAGEGADAPRDPKTPMPFPSPAFDAPRPAGANPAALDALCAAAARVRDREMEGRAELEAGLNNVVPCYLRPLCRYCPYWRGEDARPMPIGELLGYVRYLHDETGVRQFHLSGGSKQGGGDCGIIEVVEAIRAAGFDDMEVVVNCGASLTDAGLARLAELRVKRIFSVLETTNPAVFAYAKPGDDLQEKVSFARRAAAAGIDTGTGLMAGLTDPARRCEDYVDSVFDVAALPRLSAVYVSKFRPARGIAMDAHPECPLDEARALVALARLVLRGAHVRAAAGWRPEEHAAARAAGAGSLEVPLMFPRPKPGQKGCWD